MNVKEFVTKIINKNKNQINQRIKSIPKLLSVGVVSVIGLIPLTSIPNRGIAAYAQQQVQQGQLDSTTATATADPWYESLEIARSKVQAALSPGAFGHGVPDLYGLSTSELLMALGIPVVGGILTFMAVRKLINHANKKNYNVSII